MNPATTPMTITTVELTENLSKSKILCSCRAPAANRTFLRCGLIVQGALALKHHPAARHGCDHANLLQFIRPACKGLGINHNEISLLADLKAPHGMLGASGHRCV